MKGKMKSGKDAEEFAKHHSKWVMEGMKTDSSTHK